MRGFCGGSVAQDDWDRITKEYWEHHARVHGAHVAANKKRWKRQDLVLEIGWLRRNPNLSDAAAILKFVRKTHPKLKPGGEAERRKIWAYTRQLTRARAEVVNLNAGIEPPPSEIKRAKERARRQRKCGL